MFYFKDTFFIIHIYTFFLGGVNGRQCKINLYFSQHMDAFLNQITHNFLILIFYEREIFQVFLP